MLLFTSFYVFVLYLTTVDAACKWYGTAPFCSTSSSTCTDKEMVASQTSSSGDGKKCWTGHKTLCCDPQLVGCNGKESYCKLPFDQTTFAGTHNSAAGFDGLLKYGSGFPAISCFYKCQDRSFTEQLRSGIRMFDLDICYHKGTMKGCHKDAYAGSTATIFQQISDFLNDSVNRKQVVVIRVSDTSGITTSNSHILIDQMESYFQGTNGKTGLNDYHYSRGSWPTLQQAVDDNKRVFVLMPTGICSYSCFTKYRFLISMSYVGDTWQTRKITSSCSGIVADTKAKCEQYKTRTFIIDSNFASYGLCTWDMAGYCDNYLEASVKGCTSIRNQVSKTTNFLLVDFYEKSPNDDSVITIANQQNDENVRRLNL